MVLGEYQFDTRGLSTITQAADLLERGVLAWICGGGLPKAAGIVTSSGCGAPLLFDPVRYPPPNG
jgi:hypothetical protein